MSDDDSSDEDEHPAFSGWNLLITVSKFIHKFKAFIRAFVYVPLHKKLRQEGALTPPKAGRLRLATWNVSNLPKEWGGNVTEESMKLKLDNMAAVIKLSKSDIVVMQEIKVDYRMWTDANGWRSPHPLVLELGRRLQEDLEADWQDKTSGPSRADGSTAIHGKAEAYAIFWKRARVKKELGDDVSITSFVYSTKYYPYNADFREVMTWDRSRHHVIYEDEEGKDDSARRPAYFYLKGGKGTIVIATFHNSAGSKLKEKNEHGTKTSIRIRMKQLEHVDRLLPGQRVDKTKVLFALMGDFNEPDLDRPGLLQGVWSRKEYSKKLVHLEKFWAGCDKIGLRRCSSDCLKTMVKNGTHYDDIFVTGDFDAPAACYPTYEDLESWGGWKWFLPPEYNDDDHWAKFKSRVLSDHLLVYADVWPLMPLYDACKKGNIGVVRQWLNRGADVNQADEEGRTPLFVACREGHVDAARLLLEKDAEVDRAIEDGRTPLFVACYNGHVDAARLLLDNGAKVDRATEGGGTPLLVACFKGHVDAARLLLDKGARVNRADKDGQTPLYVACEEGHVDAARLLLDKGAEVDRADKDGTTPLYIACQNGHVDAARLLLDNGAEVDRADKDGAKPLSVATYKGHSAVVALLVAHREKLLRPRESPAPAPGSPAPRWTEEDSRESRRLDREFASLVREAERLGRRFK